MARGSRIEGLHACRRPAMPWRGILCAGLDQQHPRRGFFARMPEVFLSFSAERDASRAQPKNPYLNTAASNLIFAPYHCPVIPTEAQPSERSGGTCCHGAQAGLGGDFLLAPLTSAWGIYAEAHPQIPGRRGMAALPGRARLQSGQQRHHIRAPERLPDREEMPPFPSARIARLRAFALGKRTEGAHLC